LQAQHSYFCESQSDCSSTIFMWPCIWSRSNHRTIYQLVVLALANQNRNVGLAREWLHNIGVNSRAYTTMKPFQHHQTLPRVGIRVRGRHYLRGNTCLQYIACWCTWLFGDVWVFNLFCMYTNFPEYSKSIVSTRIIHWSVWATAPILVDVLGAWGERIYLAHMMQSASGYLHL
jgi:hypothetical protein